MTSAGHGKNTSAIEVSRVTGEGVWIVVDGRELHLPFEAFPWFRGASHRQLSEIERPQPRHLRWPALDVDLTLDSIEHPDRYPLVSRGGASERDAEEPGA